MLNTQLPEPLVTTGRLDVVKIWPTIQGEGPFAGRPAVFIRLAGCNLQCPLCDTDYTTERAYYTISEALEVVRHWQQPMVSGKRSLVVITGGEPFRQSQLTGLVGALNENGYMVQIETNGTIYDGHLPYHCVFRGSYLEALLTIVCSPKTPSINKLLMPYINSLKYVLSASHVGDDGLPTSVLGMRVDVARPWPEFQGEIYLQPEDHADPVANKLNQDAAVASCMKFGYRLCLQMHKIIGVE